MRLQVLATSDTRNMRKPKVSKAKTVHNYVFTGMERPTSFEAAAMLTFLPVFVRLLKVRHLITSGIRNKRNSDLRFPMPIL